MNFQEIQSKYGVNSKHMVIQTDVTQIASIESTLKLVKDSFGKPPSIVVNAAGICAPAHILKLDEALFDKIINVNLKVSTVIDDI